MFDFRSHYALVKSVMQTKAKEQHKPSLGNKSGMIAYQKAVGAVGQARFCEPKIEGLFLEVIHET